MKKVYKITFFDLIRAMWLQCVLFIGLSCVWIPILINLVNTHKYFKVGYILLFVILFGSYSMISQLYPLIIYFNHYQYDKNTIISFDAEMDSLTYTDGKESIQEKISEITTFTENYYPKNSYRLFGLYSMRYYEIFFKDGTVLVVSSLVINNLKKELNIKPQEQWTRDMFLEDDTKKTNN